MKQPVKRILSMHSPYQASAGCTVVLLVFLTNLQRAPSLASQKPGYGCKTQLFCLFFRSPTRTKLLRNKKKRAPRTAKLQKTPPARLTHRPPHASPTETSTEGRSPSSRWAGATLAAHAAPRAMRIAEALRVAYARRKALAASSSKKGVGGVQG